MGQVDFFGALAGEAGLEGEDYRRLCSLISNKNRFGVEEFCENLQLSEKLKKVFGRLPQLFGGPEVLSEAESLTENPRALAAVDAAKEKLLAGEVTVDTAFGMDEAKLKEIIGSAQ